MDVSQATADLKSSDAVRRTAAAEQLAHLEDGASRLRCTGRGHRRLGRIGPPVVDLGLGIARATRGRRRSGLG